jgi:hypothetical protein
MYLMTYYPSRKRLARVKAIQVFQLKTLYSRKRASLLWLAIVARHRKIIQTAHRTGAFPLRPGIRGLNMNQRQTFPLFDEKRTFFAQMQVEFLSSFGTILNFACKIL